MLEFSGSINAILFTLQSTEIFVLLCVYVAEIDTIKKVDLTSLQGQNRLRHLLRLLQTGRKHQRDRK